DALEPRDDALAARSVLEEDFERALRLAGLPVCDLEPLDVAFALEDLRDLDLQPRERHLHLRMPGLGRVPDPGEHVCDWISHKFNSPIHQFTNSPTAFRDACDVALERELAETETAERKLAKIRARTAAAAAAVAEPDFVLRGLQFLGDLCGGGHLVIPER